MKNIGDAIGSDYTIKIAGAYDNILSSKRKLNLVLTRMRKEFL